jgi:EAL domain-containing protein (putative c-di-GMP-specific phosphodiesterase class I)
LKAQGCRVLQGYLLGRPVPVAEFLARWCSSAAAGADEAEPLSCAPGG